MRNAQRDIPIEATTIIRDHFALRRARVRE
jgi:hypothetical protein